MEGLRRASARPFGMSKLLLAAGVASGAFAGAARAAEDPAAADVPAVSEIVVTAQKRNESLQDVPIAVSALTAEQAKAKGLDGTMSLQAAVPSLTFTTNSNTGNIFLRGVGSNLFDPSSEQSVATYIDGVYIAAPESNVFAFNNIDRVEVLKGPQGTLFGRNATGGVIQVVTKTPSQDAHADLSVGYANYDDVSAALYATGGLSETLAADIAVIYENQGDGWGRNLTTGAKTFQQARDSWAARSKWLFTPTDGTRLLFAVDYAHSVNTNMYEQPRGIIAVDGVHTYPGRYNTYAGLDGRSRINTGGASLQLDQDIGALHVVSITAWRKSDIFLALDQDAVPAVVFDDLIDQFAHNWSQEFQLSGPSDAKLKWILGAYFFDSKAGYDAGVVDYGLVTFVSHQTDRSAAVFGQATYEVVADTNLTVGLRYTDEHQKYAGTQPVVSSAKQSFNKLTFRLALDHRFAEDVMGYASFNRGFKSGGFNLLAPGTEGFRPETLDAYEVGLKSELFERRLRLNLAGFYYDYTDIQIGLPVGGGLVTVNGPRAHIKGIEADFEAVPIANLTISGGLSYVDGKYVSDAPTGFISAGGIPTVASARGHDTIATPKLTGAVTASYRVRSRFGDVTPSLSVSYNDGFFWYADNRITQPSYTLLGASVLWTSPDGRYDVRLWGKNLGNARYYMARAEQALVGDVQMQAAPRTYGITLGAHF